MKTTERTNRVSKIAIIAILLLLVVVVAVFSTAEGIFAMASEGYYRGGGYSLPRSNMHTATRYSGTVTTVETKTDAANQLERAETAKHPFGARAARHKTLHFLHKTALFQCEWGGFCNWEVLNRVDAASRTIFRPLEYEKYTSRPGNRPFLA